MRIDELDYHLPEDLIARTPADRRDAARLLVARDVGGVEHRRFTDLPDLLRPGDLLILNDTKVLPARINLTRAATGGGVEGLFLQTRDNDHWHLMLKSGGKLRPGELLTFDAAGEHRLALIEALADGSWIAARQSELDTEVLLDRFGRMPLPPYIRRRRGAADDLDALDRERYQTVYARAAGAVAAPTAGLHFTGELFDRLADRGVRTARLTLHVGAGTFAPVRGRTLDEHPMHTERFMVPAATLDALRAARREGRRIIPVGTTSVRALESLADPLPGHDHIGTTDLLIQPGFTFGYCDGLITNFHLPRSTLIALVAARVGLQRLMALYAEAITQRYRFYSYGDAMLVI